MLPPPWLAALLQDGKGTKWPPLIIWVGFHGAAALATRQRFVLRLRCPVLLAAKGPRLRFLPLSCASCLHGVALTQNAGAETRPQTASH